MSKSASRALTELLGSDRTLPTDAIRLEIPDVAEDGSLVPVTVETALMEVRSVSIVVENNPRPLAVSFEIPPGTLPSISCRIKMGASSPVTAVVETGQGLFSVTKEVRVVRGGCFG